MFIEGHISPFDSLNDDYFDEKELEEIEKELEKEKKKDKKKKKKEKKNNKDKESYDDVSETVKLQNVHEQIVNENNHIKQNHPNVYADQCVSHSEFVNMSTDTLNNYEMTNRHQQQYDSYPEYMAYNE